jgi:hypothetical protein
MVSIQSSSVSEHAKCKESIFFYIVVVTGIFSEVCQRIRKEGVKSFAFQPTYGLA